MRAHQIVKTPLVLLFLFIHLSNESLSQSTSVDYLIDSLYLLGEREPLKVMEAFERTETRIEEFQDSTKINFYVSKGFISSKLGDYTSYFSAIRKAQLLSVKTDSFMLSDIYLNYGNIYIQLDSLHKAMSSYKTSMAIADVQNKRKTLATDGIAQVYFNLEQYDSSIYYLKQNIAQLRQEQDSTGLARALGNTSMVLTETGQVEEAIQLNEEALAIEEALGGGVSTIYNYANLSKQYLDIDLEKSQRYKTKAFELAEQLGADDHLSALYSGYSEIEEEQGNYEQALAYFKEFFRLNNQQQNDLLAQSVEEWEITLENQQKDASIKNLEQKNEIEQHQNRLLLVGIGALALLIMGMLILYLKLRKSKQELGQQKAELELLNATKDKFFAIIAHDLRSPMIALQGVGDKLNYFIRKNKQQKLMELGGKIDASIDHLNHLLNNLLDWAVSEGSGVPHHPERLFTKTLVDEVISLYVGYSEAAGVLIDTSSLEDVVCYADEHTTSTILRNLMSNALKFSPEGGTVAIRSYQNDEDQTIIEIRDSGKGIPQKNIDELTQMQTKSSVGNRGEKGFGLGLRLSFEFAEVNNGRIAVNSEHGVGSVFSLILPSQGKGIVQPLKIA